MTDADKIIDAIKAIKAKESEQNNSTSTSTSTSISVKTIISLMGLCLIAGGLLLNYLNGKTNDTNTKFSKLEVKYENGREKITTLNEKIIKLSAEIKSANVRANSNYDYSKNAKSEVKRAVEKSQKIVMSFMKLQFDAMNKRLENIEDSRKFTLAQKK